MSGTPQLRHSPCEKAKSQAHLKALNLSHRESHPKLKDANDCNIEPNFLRVGPASTMHPQKQQCNSLVLHKMSQLPPSVTWSLGLRGLPAQLLGSMVPTQTQHQEAPALPQTCQEPTSVTWAQSSPLGAPCPAPACVSRHLWCLPTSLFRCQQGRPSWPSQPQPRARPLQCTPLSPPPPPST